MKPLLFVGITTWNSELFIGHAIDAWRRLTSVPLRIVVWDNESTDGTRGIVESTGAELFSRTCSQAEALDRLWQLASEEYVLLTHADVLMLSENWFELCAAPFSEEETALVSPEDVGCGPFSRPFGLGMPESSFLLLHRERAKRLERLLWRRWHGLPYARHGLDFDAPHITHHLPKRLGAAGLSWTAMDVQPSERLPESRYGPYPGAPVWSGELAYLRYGLGNFYSINGVVTHYHNWYDRIPRSEAGDDCSASRRNFPRQYVRDYTLAFLADYRAGRLVVPGARKRDREPVAL